MSQDNQPKDNEELPEGMRVYTPVCEMIIMKEPVEAKFLIDENNMVALVGTDPRTAQEAHIILGTDPSVMLSAIMALQHIIEEHMKVDLTKAIMEAMVATPVDPQDKTHMH